jgi:hypothetical protein
VSANPQSRPEGVQVGPAIGLFRQEVKHGSVVPHVDRSRQKQVPDIRRNSRHLVCLRPKTCPSSIHGGLGDVDHYDIAIALLQDPVDKKRCSPSDVDDCAVLLRRNRADQVQSSGGFPLKPAHLVGSLNCPYLLPVELRVIHGCSSSKGYFETGLTSQVRRAVRPLPERLPILILFTCGLTRLKDDEGEKSEGRHAV